jgi:hypothetical protein
MHVFTTACLWTLSFASWSCTPGHTISSKSVLVFSFHLCHELCLPRGTFLLWISRTFSALYRPMSHPFPSLSSHNWNNTSATNSLYYEDASNRSGAVGVFDFLRCDTASLGIWFPTFRDDVKVSSWRVQMSVNNYPVTRLHILEDKVFSYKVTHYVRVKIVVL